MADNVVLYASERSRLPYIRAVLNEAQKRALVWHFLAPILLPFPKKTDEIMKIIEINSVFDIKNGNSVH